MHKRISFARGKINADRKDLQIYITVVFAMVIVILMFAFVVYAGSVIEYYQ